MKVADRLRTFGSDVPLGNAALLPRTGRKDEGPLCFRFHALSPGRSICLPPLRMASSSPYAPFSTLAQVRMRLAGGPASALEDPDTKIGAIP